MLYEVITIQLTVHYLRYILQLLHPCFYILPKYNSSVIVYTNFTVKVRVYGTRQNYFLKVFAFTNKVFNARITSYNVCYTKLLRVIDSFI